MIVPSAFGNHYAGGPKMKTLVVMLIALTANLASAADSSPIVKVTGGQVRGVLPEKGGAVFKGVPYAQPPVGDLRWREPMPVKPWTGVRDATKFGPMCAQRPSPLLPNAAEITSEDCLSLNIWAMGWPLKSRLPVMVWIPGGGNFAGGSAQTQYDGERLTRRGVVVVSINYRLGTFGFFSHPALTRESPHRASGNQGILDQIAALKWVRKNITKFGGDPGNVTIFGSSAGSLDISVLMTTPLSKGLFHRAIGQSGNAIHEGDPLSLQEAEKRGQTEALQWKVSADISARDLRAVSAGEILAAEPEMDVGPSLGIIVDGYVFPRKPSDVFAAGQEYHVPLIIGSNARDYIPPLPKDLAKAITEAYGPLADRATPLYVGDADPQYGTPVEQWATDTSFRCSTVTQLKWHAAAGSPVYEYEFARVPKGREAFGAMHGAEICHVFGTLDQCLYILGPPAASTEEDVRLSDAMQQYWTNFAKTGDPNGKGLPLWPKFDLSSRAYIQFTDSGPVAKEGLRRPYCDLFIENVNRLMKR
jgi:para-nitrobenzyl esterase